MVLQHGTLGVSFCLALERGMGWAGPCMESLVTQESQESSPWFPEMARRSGSLRLPGERAARRANDWYTQALASANLGFIPNFPACLAVQFGAHYLASLSLDFLNSKMNIVNISGFFRLKCDKVYIKCLSQNKFSINVSCYQFHH